MLRTCLRKIERALIAGLLIAAPLCPEPPSPVSVYFTVEDGDKLISGLTENDLRLYEDGQPVAFRLARPESPALITAR
jgi:hypothetical protein